jgi:hypothetical protein
MKKIIFIFLIINFSNAEIEFKNNYIEKHIIEQKEDRKIEDGKLITEKYQKYDFSEQQINTKEKYKKGNNFILETVKKEYKK